MREIEFNFINSREFRDTKFVTESIDVKSYIKNLYEGNPIRNCASGRIKFIHGDLTFSFNWFSSWAEGNSENLFETGMSVFDLDLQANFRISNAGTRLSALYNNMPDISFWVGEVEKILVRDYISLEIGSGSKKEFDFDDDIKEKKCLNI